MKRTTLLKITAGLFATMVAVIGMGYVVPLLAPLHYLEVAAPRALYWMPFVLAAFVYLLVAWRSFAPREQPSSTVEYVVRVLLICLLCTIGFYTPTRYLEQHVEFMPVSGKVLEDNQNYELEKALGFRVGLQVRSEGNRLFFERAPGRAEKVAEWLRLHAAHNKRVTHYGGCQQVKKLSFPILSSLG